MENTVAAAASATIAKFATELAGLHPVQQLAKLKFEPFGHHPLEPRNLNLIEQLNQTFTYLASAQAVRWLLERHPVSGPYTLNLGTLAGVDVVSADGTVEAETFAAVDPSNNDKLNADIAKLRARPSVHKYVFYICPTHLPGEGRLGDVTVVSLGWNDVG